MNRSNRFIWFFAFLSMFLVGCLDTSGTAPEPQQIGGTVIGLSGRLTLFASGSVITLTEPGPFFFPSPFAVGTLYDVVVVEEPADQDCIVENGKGVVGPVDIIDIEVTCSEQKLYRIGGTVKGSSGPLILRNGTDTVTVSADGEYSFSVMLQDGKPYAVDVEQAPLNQACTILNDVGVVMGADVTNVDVTCVADDTGLIDLALSEGTLSPVFATDTSIYLASVGLLVPSITVIPTASNLDAIIMVNGEVVVSGMESSPIRLEFGSNIINVSVQAPSGADREYAVIVSREEKLDTTYVKASNPSALDYFGYPVAISGNLMAVGATGEDSSATGVNGDGANNDRSASGAVYVYVREGGTWKQEAYIKPSNTDTNDAFGTSIALEGNTLVVGAPGEDSKSTGIDGTQNDEGATNSGAVYVFVRDAAGMWSQQAYIKASNTGAYDRFGAAVAISGDTIAVGAPDEDSSATGVGNDQTSNSANESGAVYVFLRTGTMWEQQAYIKASNTDNLDQFGASIALLGDTLAVGATDEDSNTTGINPASNESAFEAGAVYVFVRSVVGTWAQQAFMKASNTAGGDRFGSSVALGDDMLVVGARGEDSSAAGVDGNQSDNNANDSGAVYVFGRTGGMWMQQSYIKASNPGNADAFGSSVAISGDVLAVGAFAEDSNAVGMNGSQQSNTDADSGAVYLFARENATWSQLTYLKALNTDAYDEFGKTIALSEGTLICGSHLDDSSGVGMNANPYNNTATDSGAVFVYH
ncbi:MAG: cadherin-like beta sandwich domain-containing protein [Polyangiaceae bacterium]|nr:cadherin-like beta sandwich domain-containing protein [Polyangiaceae bacterium]